MRITGGDYSGRLVRVPVGSLRPTQDRVRAALFSILANRIAGCRFADLFAGSGAVGLEARSRGAAEVYWVESDARVVRGLRENVRAICGNGHVVSGDAIRFMKNGLAKLQFDIIFCDPPYEAAADGALPAQLLTVISETGRLAAGGLVVFELRRGSAGSVGSSWQMIDERVYGETCLRFMAAAAGPAERRET